MSKIEKIKSFVATLEPNQLVDQKAMLVSGASAADSEVTKNKRNKKCCNTEKVLSKI
ncbi:hypothetical protein [Saccharicrinis fermentans]|uniref:Uncharacterized protein n=1 Tax=Saccharicrinis fermentans DSM 9555 = JCM 21142 TaxID=869213 RepID=W7YE01_9BACT|nr:hypothetical protein [Saccharicrinis fermentans]GAF05698.1 hypothetical protein JCM21142_104444 [Saccharicrinis fermentans DSM 9555 = JCM 21142]